MCVKFFISLLIFVSWRVLVVQLVVLHLCHKWFSATTEAVMDMMFRSVFQF